jgi:hypothetical protein
MDFASRVVADVQRTLSMIGAGTLVLLGPNAAAVTAVTQALLVLGLTGPVPTGLDEDQLGLIADVFRELFGTAALPVTIEQIEQITKAFSLAVMAVPVAEPTQADADLLASNKKRKRDPDPDSDAIQTAVQRAQRSVARKKLRVEALTCALTLGLLVRPVTLPSGKSFSMGALMEHFKTCTEQRKARTCPMTRCGVPDDWTPIVNTDLRDIVDCFVCEIKEEEAEETVPEAAHEWADLIVLCSEYHATKATAATLSTVATAATERSQRSPRSPRSRSPGPFMVYDEEDFHVPSPALGPDDFPLFGCTVKTLNYPGREFRVTGMNPDGAAPGAVPGFSLTPLPVTTRGARLTLPECQIMTVHVTRDDKNKRIKIVFNKHREPPGPPGGSYNAAVQRAIGMTGLTGVITGFDNDNAIVKIDNDNVQIVPLRHCALYTAA